MPEISQVRGQFIILSDDGEQFGPYDDKQQAAAKYRELQREENGGMQDQSQSKAQRAATRFSSGVNTAARKAGQAGRKIADKAEQAAEQPEEDTERTESSGPSLPGGSMGGGMSSDGPGLEMFGGAGEAELPFMQESETDQKGGPSLDFLGGDAEAPMFGGSQDNPEMPQIMGDGPEIGQLPFGGMENSDEKEDGFPFRF